MSTITTKYDIGQEVFVVLYSFDESENVIWHIEKGVVHSVLCFSKSVLYQDDDGNVICSDDSISFPTLELAQAECDRRNRKDDEDQKHEDISESCRQDAELEEKENNSLAKE